MPGTQSKADRPEVDLLVRKSKIVREGENALSLRAQEERGRRWADENGYTVRKVWRENLSAYSDVERPKYDAAMKAVLDGEVPALWCYALDRFSRKGIEAIGPILGTARVIFDYEQLDSSNERDRRWIIQRAEDAREYSQRLSYNVRNTKNRQRNEGRWLARAPFGLVADKARKLSPKTTLIKGKDYSPWDVVCRIFKEIAEGTSSRALARKFNTEGVKSATGKTWRADSIRAIVIHPVFEGWLTVSPGGKSHKAPVHYLNDAGERVRCVTDEVLPHMIPAELAAKARRVLSGHQIIDNTPRPGRAKALLAGRLRCASCGNAMVADGKSYNCQLRASGGACENPASVWRESLEAYAVGRWLARMHAAEIDDPLIHAVAQRWEALTKPEESAELQEAMATLKAAEAALDKFHADDRAGFYSGRSAKYRLPAKKEAEDRLTAAEERVSELSGGPIDISFLLNGDAPEAWEDADDALRRDLFGLAVEQITVTRAPKQGVRFKGDERVTIEWANPVQVEELTQAA
ncbi:recombinase family protein [Streptomyces sp. SA15]|uniref:recombinase family protein n=1 Tax=Streptomyces sp. SA15 TaxID=934019 RepID=UPI0015CBFC6A|nr:recombinase family protein [Streptomyces sp. SA15]